MWAHVRWYNTELQRHSEMRAKQTFSIGVRMQSKGQLRVLDNANCGYWWCNTYLGVGDAPGIVRPAPSRSWCNLKRCGVMQCCNNGVREAATGVGIGMVAIGVSLGLCASAVRLKARSWVQVASSLFAILEEYPPQKGVDCLVESVLGAFRFAISPPQTPCSVIPSRCKQYFWSRSIEDLKKWKFERKH